MKTSTPGKPIRGSSTGRPIMTLLDILGRRWSMRVLWELSVKPCTFRELQACCEKVSSSVLNTRLAELREAKLICSGSAGYCLSSQGAELMQVIAPLRAWAEQWGESFDGEAGEGM